MRRSTLQQKRITSQTESVKPSSVTVTEVRDSQQYFEMPLEVQMEDEVDETETLQIREDGKISVHVVYDDQYINELDDLESGYSCEVCFRCFPNLAGLRTHKRSHKNEPMNTKFVRQYAAVSLPSPAPQPSPEIPPDEEEMGHVCNTCRRSFPNIFGLRTHQRFHNHRQSPQAVPSGSKCNLIRKAPRSRVSRQKLEKMEIIRFVQEPSPQGCTVLSGNLVPNLLTKDPLAKESQDNFYSTIAVPDLSLYESSIGSQMETATPTIIWKHKI